MIASLLAHALVDLDRGHALVEAALLAVAAIVLVGAVLAHRRAPPSSRLRLLAAVAVAGIGFQLFHAAEHVAQVGYWAAHPTRPPWLTPWAAVGRDALAAATDGRHTTGAELLHLVGNLIFLAGVMAAVVIARHWHLAGARIRSLRWALWLQAAHVAEHSALTITALVAGEGHGLSTGFGLLIADTPEAVAVRVWLHLLVNLAATMFALVGLLEMRRARRPPASATRPPSAITSTGPASAEAARSVGTDNPVRRRR